MSQPRANQRTDQFRPVSVVVALAATGGLLVMHIALEVASPKDWSLAVRDPSFHFRCSIAGLVLGVFWGLWRRFRFVWQWGRIVMLLGGTLFGVVTLIVCITTPPWKQPLTALAVYVLYSVLPLTVFFSLGRAEAKRYFGLFCPRCSRAAGTAANRARTKAKCAACGHVW